MGSRRRVVVSGLGVVSPLGCTHRDAWASLLKGVCAVSRLEEAPYERLPCRVAARIPESSLCLEKRFGAAAMRTMSRATALGLVAAEEALRDAGWTPQEERDKERTGVAFGIAMIDLEDVATCGAILDAPDGYRRLSPHFIPRVLPNMGAGRISMLGGFRGPVHCASTACATGAHAIGDGFRFIKHGDAEVMVCGGAEACVGPLAMAGFARLRALATSFNDDPRAASRPFDRRREGFVMGEGAAVLVLEELEHAVRRGAPLYAEVLGYGLSGDASHATAPRPDGSGAELSMRRALDEARLTPSEVGHVNAHATSTPLGDAVEAKAIQRLLGDRCVVTATKGAHGHLLGAAGNLESAFAVLACRDAAIPPTLNLDDASDVAQLDYAANAQRAWSSPNGSRRVALKNSFGFGGTNATLCFGEMA